MDSKPSQKRWTNAAVGAADLTGRRAFLDDLRAARDAHPLWSCRLLAACSAGHLTLDDFRFVFSQYYLYSRNFTRYLAALLTSCEDDFYRSRLSENLWEEGGGAEPEERHAEIFRGFLRDGLKLETIEGIEYEDFTRHFVSEYLSFTQRASPLAASAFLSLGTEGIVARLYEVLRAGLRRAGVANEHLRFFDLHIGCDDAHAETLEQMMLAGARGPESYAVCFEAMQRALTLRLSFFENLYEAIERRRLAPIVEHIQERRSLVQDRPDAPPLVFREGAKGTPLYENDNARLNIRFSVERVPFEAEVLDPRVVRIPPGKNNENHRHAHETVFVVLEGKGRIVIDGRELPLEPGTFAFVPRWAFHQSHNTSETEELRLLAITDFGLTGKAFVGNYERTARMKGREGREDEDAPQPG